MRRLRPLLLAFCVLVLLAAPAQAERRTALVIGNGNYSAGPLANPSNDARDMAGVLKRLGFDVTLVTDGTYQQMDSAVSQFGRKLRQGGLGLFYYAGHGIQVAGENYLVPVDAAIQTEGDVKFKCLNAGFVLAKMEDAGNGLNVVILDACRNNPFGRSFRSAERGLAKMDASDGSLIAFATGPGKTAEDGNGKNGTYTKFLLQNIATPGLSLNDMFMRVRQGVREETGKRQVPWEVSSLTGNVYLAGGAGAAQPGSSGVELQAEKQRVVEEAARLKREQEELAQLQTLKAEQARLEAERQKLEQAKQQLTLAPAPKQPTAGSPGQTWRDPVTGMEFVWVPGGTFEMGCGSWAGECSSDEKPVHSVRLSGFWLAKYEVTQGQWQKVMGNNPSHFKNGGNYPVEFVSWVAAKAFISTLNAKDFAKFRLPTEAEWEYAARNGGKPEKYSGGDHIDRVAWYGSNYRSGSTQQVGTKAPNGLGLFDMSGNVWEWCEDVYGSYPSSSQDNPIATGDEAGRVIRGGGWSNGPQNVRSTARRNVLPAEWNSDVGFRLVRIP